MKNIWHNVKKKRNVIWKNKISLLAQTDEHTKIQIIHISNHELAMMFRRKDVLSFQLDAFFVDDLFLHSIGQSFSPFRVQFGTLFIKCLSIHHINDQIYTLTHKTGSVLNSKKNAFSIVFPVSISCFKISRNACSCINVWQWSSSAMNLVHFKFWSTLFDKRLNVHAKVVLLLAWHDS